MTEVGPSAVSGDTSASAPMFSFLTPAYRTESTVGRTIQAVLDQTVSDWEMVVVDNGNVDAMRDAVTPYLSDPRIRLVRQENSGAAGGTMAAARESTGRYLVVLNSDDSIRPEFLERMAEVVGDHPEVAAVTCDADLFEDPGMRPLGSGYLRGAGQVGRPDPTRPLRVSEVIDGPCPYYTAAIRRDVWESVGGMSSMDGLASRIDDLDFWLRALTAGHDIRMLPDSLCYFRIAAGSVSRPDDPEASEEHEAQVQASLRRAAERSGRPEDREALERALARLRYWQALRRAQVALRAGSARDAVAQYDIALRHRRTRRVVALRRALRAAPALVLSAYRLRRRIAVARSGRGA